MSDKRRHARVSLRDRVTFNAEGTRVDARSVDISRTGMQVVVHVPASYREVESITFRLPHTGNTLEIPCHIARREPANSESAESEPADSESSDGSAPRDSTPAAAGAQQDGHVLGLTFDALDETQLLLIEDFVRQQKEEAILEEAEHEERRIPRTSCDIAPVRAALCSPAETRGAHSAASPGSAEARTAAPEVLSIDNISTEGLLLSFRGRLSVGQSLSLAFALPGSKRRVKLEGTVMYAIDQDRESIARAGLRIDTISEVDRNRIRNFVLAGSSRSTIEQLDRWIARRAQSGEYRMDDQERIAALFSTLAAEETAVYALLPGSHDLYAFRVLAVEREASRFRTTVPVELRQELDGESLGEEPIENVRAGFTHDGGGHFFTTRLHACLSTEEATSSAGQCEALLWELPRTLFRLEKRAQDRWKPSEERELLLHLDHAESGTIRARLVDLGPHGFRCELPLSQAPAEGLSKGAAVSYRLGEQSAAGEIRHVTTGQGRSGDVLHIGIEQGIRRSSYAFTQLQRAKWEQEEGYASSPKPDDGPSTDHSEPTAQSRVVRYPNRDGNPITALVNEVGEVRDPQQEPTVVIMPPAFGKKKEALAPLAMTLAANFAARGRPLVTIRYDGTDRPGESHNALGHRPRGYEMLHYRISRGKEDLEATLDYATGSSAFAAERIVLVTFSMSALDARKLLLEERYRGRIDQWISVMGVPAAQSALSATLGGIDAIGNYKMGIPTGVCGLLGHLVDMDHVTSDLLEHGYAHITEARNDMARLDLPVLWIYGRFDGWIDPEEIHDVMSVEAEAPRSVVEIPAGHNLRTSEDAVKTFKRIAGAMLETLFGITASPLGPSKEATLALIASERERLEAGEELPAQEYWHRYLLGSGAEGTGYDFYRRIPAFRDFLRREAALAELAPGTRVADFGCGTGLFLEAALESFSAEPARSNGLEITAVDLVPEALSRARAKTQALQQRYGLSAQIEYRQMDLETNRLVPVWDLLSGRARGMEDLRGRIEGLTNTLLDSLKTQLTDGEFRSLVTGPPLSEHACGELRGRLGEACAEVVEDLSLAARFLSDGEAKTAAELPFKRLSFGESTRSLWLPFPQARFDRVVASLFVSYLFDPEVILRDFHRMLAPGGRAVISSMRPDSDISLLFTGYVQDAQQSRYADLASAREMLNEAAGLFEREEEGYFRFFDEAELTRAMESAGFSDIHTERAMGTPPQAIIAVGRRQP